MPAENRKVRSLPKSLQDNPNLSVLDMILRWEEGCFTSQDGHPESCTSCTLALIQAIKEHELRIVSACVSIDFVEAYKRIKAICEEPSKVENRGFGSKRLFEKADIVALIRNYKTALFIANL